MAAPVERFPPPRPLAAALQQKNPPGILDYPLDLRDLVVAPRSAKARDATLVEADPPFLLPHGSNLKPRLGVELSQRHARPFVHQLIQADPVALCKLTQPFMLAHRGF